MWHTDWVEILGFITGALCVWLLAKENIWNWPIGIANNLFYIVVFARSGLFGDAGLNGIYAVLSVYGWWSWLNPEKSGADMPVTRTTPREWLWLGIATATGAVLLRMFLAKFTSSTVPGWDGLTTALSLAATWGQCRKLVESWWIWIFVDLIYVPLYVYKDLRLTAGLNFIFLLMCIGGLRAWSRTMRETLPAAA